MTLLQRAVAAAFAYVLSILLIWVALEAPRSGQAATVSPQFGAFR
jgi:hypothetical protein